MWAGRGGGALEASGPLPAACPHAAVLDPRLRSRLHCTHDLLISVLPWAAKSPVEGPIKILEESGLCLLSSVEQLSNEHSQMKGEIGPLPSLR